MSDNLWFLNDGEKPAGAPPAQPVPPQGDVYAQGYAPGPATGGYPQGYPSDGTRSGVGEAASYYNAGFEPTPAQGAYNPPPANPFNPGEQFNQGPPPIPQASRPYEGQGSYGGDPSQYGTQPPFNQPDNRGLFDGFQQQQQSVPGQGERGLFGHRNPIDPPPALFTRPPPDHYTYIPFAPMSVFANGEGLQDGFALTPPPAKAGDQHPFASHDITKEDWEQFLNDLQKVAHLPFSERLFSGNFLANRVTSEPVQGRMSEKNVQHVGDYLMAYNQYFFHPRRISVVLALGRQRYSGETDEIPPDLRSPGKSEKDKSGKDKDKKEKDKSHKDKDKSSKDKDKSSKDKDKSSKDKKSKSDKKKYDSGSESGTESSGSEDGGHGHSRLEDRIARREERRERREKRKDDRKERRAEHSGGKHEKHDKHDKEDKHKEEYVEVHVPENRFRLVLSYWDGSREVY